MNAEYERGLDEIYRAEWPLEYKHLNPSNLKKKVLSKSVIIWWRSIKRLLITAKSHSRN